MSHSTLKPKQYQDESVLARLGTLLGLFAVGIQEPIAIIAFGVIAFVITSIFEEWVRGTRSRHRSGENWAVAFWRLINGNRPRHGGYVAHLAILALSLQDIKNLLCQKMAPTVILAVGRFSDQIRRKLTIDSKLTCNPCRILQGNLKVRLQSH